MMQLIYKLPLGRQLVSKYCHKSCFSTSSTFKDSFFVTTPIFYVNADPHIGHLYSLVMADAIHRYHCLKNEPKQTIFSTGTDEHGIKVQKAAEARNLSPDVFCDQISNKFKQLASQFNASNNCFMRTSDGVHKQAVTKLWSKLQENNVIYKSKYEGWYCSSDECFTKDVIDIEINGQAIKVSAESNNPVEWVTEENYMFKMSQFKDQLLNWIENEKPVTPVKFNSLAKHIIETELQDISISRPANRVSWAIKVPNDESQTIYVWLDALVNYLTATGYASSDTLKIWPPNVQVIGKDILKFHAIYWPAFLMAANLDLPSRIICHSHWMINDRKMSKSLGNVICPFGLASKCTHDGLRYFLLREGVTSSDGNFSMDYFKTLLVAELSNTYGNLLGRSLGTCNPAKIFPSSKLVSKYSSKQIENLIAMLKSLPDNVSKHYSDGHFYKGIDEIMKCLREANNLFQVMKPWALVKVKSEKDRLNTCLFLSMETIRMSSILLQPIIPEMSNKALDGLGVPKNERLWRHSIYNDGKDHDTPIGEEKIILFHRDVLKNLNM